MRCMICSISSSSLPSSIMSSICCCICSSNNWPLYSLAFEVFGVTFGLVTLRLFLSGAEHALFVASDALVGVQAFEDKLGCRHLNFRRICLLHAEGVELFVQSLNIFERGHQFG